MSAAAHAFHESRLPSLHRRSCRGRTDRALNGRINRRAGLSRWPVILLLVIVAGCGSSDQAEDARARSSAASVANAADEYRRIYAALDPALVEACKDLEGLPGLSMELQESLDANRGLIEDLIAASMLDECDFGTDYSVGLEVELPHLAHMRWMSKVLRADAFRYGNAGNPEGAARRLIAIVRVAQHLAEAEPIVISKAVGFANLDSAHKSAGELMTYDMLDAAARRILREELSRIDARDPLDAKGALALEIESSIITIRKARGYDPDLEFDFTYVSDVEREEAIAQIRDAIARIEAAWDSPNAVDQMRDITDSLTNPIARYVVLIMPPYREQVDLAAQRLREFIDRLEP
jgi:hypothetical protein